MKTEYIASLLGAALLFGACDKMPENGSLDGQWQLMERTDATTGTSEAQKDKAIYWRFQLKLLQIYTPDAPLNGHSNYTLARFRHTGDSLLVTQTYLHFDNTNRDSLITDKTTHIFRPLGIEGNSDAFRVEKLDDRRLVLRSKWQRLTFRKF